MSRHFLFLQGLPGPSSRLLARRLAAGGARTSRINLSGGDWYDWRFSGTNFRGHYADFAAWIDGVIARDGVTDLVMFGERRPLHRQAIAVAQARGIDVYILEEGYLRPHSVTLERWPRGHRWQPPRSLADCRVRLAGQNERFEDVPLKNFFRRRMREAVLHGLFTVLLRPLYPHYRSHRPLSAGAEVNAWTRRWLRRGREQRDSDAALAALGERSFFLFPLQLDGDAQLVHNSPFASMAEALGLAAASFAAHAPDDAVLLVKRHPFDPDPDGWRGHVAALAAQTGLGDRLLYVERADLDPLLDRCQGVVTVNSTVGLLALNRGKPVKALGRAIYGLDGLVHPAPLDGFWQAPVGPEGDAIELFDQTLWRECLVNGGFHSGRGVGMMTAAAAPRMLGTAP